MLRNDVTYGPTAAIFYRPERKHLCYNCLQSIIGRDTEVVLRIPAQWVVRIEIRSLLGSLAKCLDGPSNYRCWMLDFRIRWNGHIHSSSASEQIPETERRHDMETRSNLMTKRKEWATLGISLLEVSRTWGIASPMVIWREPPAQLLFLKWSMQCLSYTAAGAYPVEWSQITPKQPRDMAEGQLANMTWMCMQNLFHLWF